jgi:hypothetical protein
MDELLDEDGRGDLALSDLVGAASVNDGEAVIPIKPKITRK